MRKSRTEAAETRARIVSVAATVFLERGLESVGMRDVMEAAGLTAGGFYRHFSSKDQLIAEAMQNAFDRLFAMFDEATVGMSPEQSLECIVTLYLEQTRHKESEAEPYLCPMAQLGSQLAKSSSAIRFVAVEGHTRLEALIAGCLPERSKSHRAKRANAIVSTLVGAVTAAKIASDPESAARTLVQARRAILQR